jgi:two-component system NtrC family sensor kinase
MAEHVVIAFADNGPGISAEDLNYIFDPFYTRKKTMGMGVGLSICYGIIKKLGGEIEARSTKGEGSDFRVRIPISEKSDEDE